MTTYPNQKMITVEKAEANKKNIYAILSKQHLFEAIRELSHPELKVYLYLASNQNNYRCALSSKDIAEETGTNQRVIQRAIQALLEKGYIMQMHENEYTFLE